MAHVHFDLDEVVRRMRRMREEAVPAIIASAASDLTRDGFIAQDRFFETSISAQVEMMRMLNEGRDARFVGTTVGAIFGTIVINTLSASDDEDACLAAIQRSLDRSLRRYFEDCDAGCVTTKTEVHAVPSGSA